MTPGAGLKGRSAGLQRSPPWPFAEIAKHAARWRPDLIIHVGTTSIERIRVPRQRGVRGEPLRRELGHPGGRPVHPPRPLLRAAPWVFVRGNHETCARGGEGWFRILYPLPMPPTCLDYTEPYKLSLGKVDLLVLDSAITNDFAEPPDQVAAFKAQFETLRELATDDSWLITHKPLYVFGHAGEQNGVEQLFIDQLVLQEASENDFPATIRLFIGGHVHLFENAALAPVVRLSWSSATVGLFWIRPSRRRYRGIEMAGMPVASGVNRAQFGFVILQRHRHRWTATLRDVEGAPLFRCALRDDSLTCEPAEPSVRRERPSWATDATRSPSRVKTLPRERPPRGPGRERPARRGATRRCETGDETTSRGPSLACSMRGSIQLTPWESTRCRPGWSRRRREDGTV